jgi:hypothetical protein
MVGRALRGRRDNHFKQIDKYIMKQVLLFSLMSAGAFGAKPTMSTFLPMIWATEMWVR